MYTHTYTHTHAHALSLSGNHDLNPCLNQNFICVCVQSAKVVGEGSEFNVSPLIKNGSKKGSCACLCGGQGLWEYQQQQAYDKIREAQSHVLSRILLSRMQPRIYLLNWPCQKKMDRPGINLTGPKLYSIKKSSHLCWALQKTNHSTVMRVHITKVW